MNQPMNQSEPVPPAFDMHGIKLIIGMRLVFCHVLEPELDQVEGELIKISHTGFFIYVQLTNRLLPESAHPEILITPPGLWVYKRRA